MPDREKKILNKQIRRGASQPLSPGRLDIKRRDYLEYKKPWSRVFKGSPLQQGLLGKGCSWDIRAKTIFVFRETLLASKERGLR